MGVHECKRKPNHIIHNPGFLPWRVIFFKIQNQDALGPLERFRDELSRGSILFNSAGTITTSAASLDEWIVSCLSGIG
ncbi:Hypothetical protein NTJ_00571 [Nesidiocoris tenuis]|uniref:Thioester reductase (TE) domain-containing protein n=1 Tax=Nesidiocoris tenuis TaxID=355587 RepID=A0ABN7AA88_9HEMI|nr:Hypothetical protein NTJ_00571 [Nesidiocoris tenuis]